MSGYLEPGETKLSVHHVGLVEDRRKHPATLVLTSQRLLLLYAPPPPTWAAMFGVLGALLGEAVARKERVRYQIRRDRFVAVEAGDGGILVFHDSGEGYAHTSFAITSKESVAEWQQRMHRWASNTPEGGPIPPARVVDR